MMKRLSQLRDLMPKLGITFKPYRDDTWFVQDTRTEYFDAVPTEYLVGSVIFFDPDTGLEPGRPPEKYLLYSELRTVWERASDNSAVVIYQHLQWNAKKHAGDLERRLADVSRCLHVSTFAVRWHGLAFVVAAKNPEGARRICLALQRYAAARHKHVFSRHIVLPQAPGAREIPVTKELKQPLGSRFSEALTLAADIHRHQPRKGTQIPYVSHVLGVVSVALEYGANEDEAIAALLHDAIEDAPDALGDSKASVVRGWIRLKFGEQVLGIVEGCTDADEDPKLPWRTRKEQYVSKIAGEPPSVLLVSASDKLHNVRSILRDYRTTGDALWSRFNPEAGRDGTVGYYRGLALAYSRRVEAVGDARVATLVKEFEQAV